MISFEGVTYVSPAIAFIIGYDRGDLSVQDTFEEGEIALTFSNENIY